MFLGRLWKRGLNLDVAQSDGKKDRLASAVSMTLERLEERILFGWGWYRGVEAPLDIGPGTDCDTVVQANPNTGTSAASDKNSSGPVNYFNGQPEYSSTDLVSNGFGKPWGVTRSWSGLDGASQMGNGWVVDGLPYMVITKNQWAPSHGGTLAIVGSGQSQERFEIQEYATGQSASDFTAHNQIQDQLIYIPPATVGGQNVPGYFQLSDTAGNITTFYDLPRDPTHPVSDLNYPNADYGRLYGGNGHAQEVTDQWQIGGTSSGKYRFGAFRSFQDASGNLTTAIYDPISGNLSEVDRTDSSGKAERFVYAHTNVSNTVGGSMTLISSVTLQRRSHPSDPWKAIQAAEYEYYDGGTDANNPSDANGRLGDLKRVTIKDYQKDPDNPQIVNPDYSP